MPERIHHATHSTYAPVADCPQCFAKYTNVRAVLLDLIAELRACPVLPATREDLEPLRDMADRAEARLREVQGE